MNVKVEFVQWVSGDVVYSATENTSLLGFSFSAKKMASVSYFATESMRLKLTFLKDDWLETALLSPGQALDRTISKYKVKFYINETLKFTGLVQLSDVSGDEALEEIDVTAYDMLKLYTIYSDLTKKYEADAYAIQWFYWWLNNDIRVRLGGGVVDMIDIPSSSILIENKKIWTCDISDIIEKVRTIRETYHHSWTDDTFQHALYFYSSSSYGVKIVYLAWTYDHISYGFTDGMYLVGKVWSVYNNMCVVRSPEYDVDEYFAFDGSVFDALPAFKATHPVYSGIVSNSLNVLDRNYSHEIEGGYLSTSLGTMITPPLIDIYYTGYVPSYYSIDVSSETENNQLEVLKKLMIIRNMSLWCDAEGRLRLSPKRTVGKTIVINPAHVVSMKSSHVYPETLKADKFSVLKGDTTALAMALSEVHNENVSQTMGAKIVIVGDYDILLFDILVIGNKQFRTVEVTPNYLKEEYSITAWRIYAQDN